MVGRTATRLQVLQALVTKHISDPAFNDISSDDDFEVTSTDRGVSRYEHPHLIAALDCLLIYQSDRRAAAGPVGMRYRYTRDPRTRMIELLKRWLRAHAASRSLEEDDVARVSNLCRDLLNHSDLFPSRNSRSFMRTLADVYDHLHRQLRDVLEHDRTCAELATRVMSLSRNLVSDAVAFLILGPTDLTQTDRLASLEVVSLWASITPGGAPLPAADEAQQGIMREAWGTYCGALLRDVLSTPWTIRVFHGATTEDLVAKMRAGMIQDGAKPADGKPARHPADSMRDHIAWVAAEFDGGNFSNSGLAGPFRQRGHQPERARLNYLYAVQGLFDLLYLLSEVLTQFHRISDGLGDYGLIRIAPWLHPCLDSMVEKVQGLKSCLEELNDAVDTELVLAKARGVRVKKPRPSELMSARAHSAIQRAVASRDSHVQLLLVALKELRERSSPERLPHVMEGLGTACLQLQGVLESAQFRKCVGDVAEKFPPLQDMGAPMQDAFPALIRAESLGTGTFSSEDDDEEPTVDLDGRCEQAAAQTPPGGRARERTPPAPPADLAPLATLQGRRPEARRERSQEPAAARGGGQERLPARSRSQPADDRPGRAISMDVIELPSPMAAGGSLSVEQLAPAGEMRADVWRLTESWRQAHTLKRRDQRGLLLTGAELHIFEKGSTDRVKTKVDVRRDIETCTVMSDGTLILTLRRQASGGESALEKAYYFQFDKTVSAHAFHDAIQRVVDTGTW